MIEEETAAQHLQHALPILMVADTRNTPDLRLRQLRMKVSRYVACKHQLVFRQTAEHRFFRKS